MDPWTESLLWAGRIAVGSFVGVGAAGYLLWRGYEKERRRASLVWESKLRERQNQKNLGTRTTRLKPAQPK